MSSTTAPVPTGVRYVRLALLPMAAFLASRLFDLAIVMVVARRPSTMWSRGDVGAALSSWDGQWYRRIATSGYPANLSYTAGGAVRHNALAFFPGYPGLVAALQSVTGLGFVPVGLAVTLLSGLSCAALLPVLVAPWTGSATAIRVGVLWAASPVSAVMTLTYSDPLFALETVLFLLAVTRHRLRWLVMIVPAAALTRGVVLPLAVVVAVHFWSGREHLVRRSQRVAAALAVTAVAAASLLWPAIVGARIGAWDGYLRIQQSWQHHLVPVAPWGAAVLRLGVFDSGTGQRDVVVLVAFVTAALAVAGLRTGLPPALAAYAPAALAYLFLLLPPTPSFLRFTLPIVTLAVPAAAWLRDRVSLAVVLVGSVLAQLWWLQSHLPYLPGHHVTP